MFARRDICVGITNFDADPAGNIFGGARYWVAIEFSSNKREIDSDPAAQCIAVPGWKIPKNAVPDLIALGDNMDRFRDVKRPISVDPNVAGKVTNPLIRPRRRGKGEHEYCDRQEQLLHSTLPVMPSLPKSRAKRRRWVADSSVASISQ
jgi:hypothetical protein